MISYLEGKLLKKENDRVVILTHGVGYDVLLPPIVRHTLEDKRAGDDGDDIRLHIFYYHGERQPRPTLVGFTNETQKEFFELFTTISDIGPAKATKLISVPIHQLAQAIEDRNASFLVKIKGLGPKLADKIIAHLYGKVGKYALMVEPQARKRAVPMEDVAQQVLEVMVKQLGHKRVDALNLIKEALERNPQADSPEELFEEVYRSQRK